MGACAYFTPRASRVLFPLASRTCSRSTPSSLSSLPVGPWPPVCHTLQLDPLLQEDNMSAFGSNPNQNAASNTTGAPASGASGATANLFGGSAFGGVSLPSKRAVLNSNFLFVRECQRREPLWWSNQHSDNRERGLVRGRYEVPFVPISTIGSHCVLL